MKILCKVCLTASNHKLNHKKLKCKTCGNGLSVRLKFKSKDKTKLIGGKK